MANCVNINHPDIKRLSTEFNIEPVATAAIVGVWQEKNTLDRFPSSDEFRERLNPELLLATIPEISDKVTPVKGLTGNNLSVEDFVTENNLDKIDIEYNKQGDKTYNILFNKAKEYDIIIKGSLQNLTNDKDIEKAEALAGYNKKSNQIILDPKYENLNELSQARILGHEIIHGIINKEFNKKLAVEKNTILRNLRGFVKDLDVYKENNPAIQRVLNIIEKNNNVEEVITYALTDTAFASELNAIVIHSDVVEVKPITLWDKLRDLILSIISDDYTKMDELLSILNYHFDVQNQKKLDVNLNTEGVLKQKELYNKEKINTLEVAKRNKRSKIKDNSTFENQVMNDLEDKMVSVINKMGASYEEVDTIVDRNGQPMNTLGKADLLNQVVQVVKSGKDLTTLPEEASHMFVKLLGEDNKLYKQMMGNIKQFKIYDQVVKEYGAIYDYNETRLKEEAIGKLIGHIILDETIKENPTLATYFKNWWNRIWNAITKMMEGVSPKELDPYVRAAKMVMNEEVSDLQKLGELEESEYELVYYDLTDQEKIERTKILDSFFNPSVELDRLSHTYFKKEGGIVDFGDSVANTASDSVKEYYYREFKKVGFINSDANIFADKGVYVHGVLENLTTYYKGFALKDGSSSPLGQALGKKSKDKDATLAAVRKDLIELADKDASFFTMTQSQYESLALGTYNIVKQIKKKNEEIKKTVGVDYDVEIFPELAVYNDIKDEAGTIDLAAVYANGSVGIYDYKSMVFKQLGDDIQDVPEYKRGAFDVQMNRYKNILEFGHGVSNFGESRIVPINVQFKTDKKGNPLEEGFAKIEMGFREGFDYLEQIPVAGERTNDAKLNESIDYMEKFRDNLIAKLKKDYTNTRLRERLENINRSLDKLIIHKDVLFVYDEINAIYKDFKKRQNSTFNSPDKMTMDDLGDMLQYLDYYEVYMDFSANAIKLLKTEDLDKVTRAKIDGISDFLNNLKSDIHNTVIEYIGHVRNTNIKQDVKDVALAGRLFKQLSEFNSPIFKVISSLVSENADQTRRDQNELVEDITNKKDKLSEWASSKGLNLFDAYELLLNPKTKNLTGRYQPEYNEAYVKATEDKNVKWIKENTDYVKSTNPNFKSKMEQDRAAYKQALEKEIVGKNKDRRIAAKMKTWGMKYDYLTHNEAYFNKFNGYIRLKDNPSYYNERFAYIHENKPLLDYFLTYEKYNDVFREITDGKVHRNSVAEIKRTMVGMAAETGVINAMKNIVPMFISAFEVEEFDPSSIQKDSQGNPIKVTPLRFTQLITKKSSDAEVEQLSQELIDAGHDPKSKEFSLLLASKVRRLEIQKGRDLKSSDLTKNLILFSKGAFSYKYLSETENLAKAVQVIAKTSKVQTELLDSSGNKLVNKLKSTVIKRIGLPSHMIDVLDNYVDMYWYGGASKELHGFQYGAKYDKEGRKIADGKVISSSKMLQGLMSITSIKALGLQPILSAGNALGIFTNAYMGAAEGIYYDKSQMKKALGNLTSRDKTSKAMYKFFEVSARDLTIEKANKASGSWMTRLITMDNMFFMYKHPDDWIDDMILDAMSMNFGLEKQENGSYELVRLNKESNKDKGIKSIKELSKYDEKTGKFYLDGYDMNEKELSIILSKFRKVVMRRSTSVKGSIPEEDKYQANKDIAGKMVMQFRSWIPGLFKTRFKAFEYDADINEADVGRFSVLFQEVMHSGNLNGIVTTFMKLAGEILVSAPGMGKLTDNYSFFRGNVSPAALRLYNKYLDENKIKRDKFTYEDFVELRLAKLKGMATEIGIYLSMIGLAALAKAAIPDDEDDPMNIMASNIYKVIRRGLLESSFWFDPSSATSWIDKPVVLMRTITDISNLVGNTFDVGRDMFLNEDDPYRAILKKSQRDKTPLGYYLSHFIPGLSFSLNFINHWDKPLN